MAHPQSDSKGFFSKRRIDVPDGSGNNASMTANSTGLVLSSGVRISNQANGSVTANSTGLVLAAGIEISNSSTAVLTGNTTGVVFTGGVQISSARYITADSTGFVLTAESALPGNVDGGNQFTLVSNSTGVALAVNTTGTTWKYLNVTSVQPT